MNYHNRRFKIGLLVLGSCVMFVSMVLFILGSSLSSSTVTYYILFQESVKGMVVGSKVNFHGIPVGSVTNIRFVSGNTQVEIGVEEDIAMIQDVTRAHMDRLLVTGQVTVELEGYQKGGEPLPEGALIHATLSPMDELAQSLPNVVAGTDNLLSELALLARAVRQVFDEENLGNVKKTLGHVAASSQRLDPLLAETEEAVAALRPALGEMEASFRALTKVAQSKDWSEALSAAHGAMVKLDAIEGEVLHLVGDLRGLASGSRREWLQALVTAKDALQEVRDLARNLRMAPNSMIFGRDVQEIRVPAAPAARGGN